MYLIISDSILQYFIVLCRTTENTRSVNAESDVANGKRTTLLHPREEAERARAASQYIQVSYFFPNTFLFHQQ